MLLDALPVYQFPSADLISVFHYGLHKQAIWKPLQFVNKSSHVFLALTHLLAVETFIYVLSGNNAQWECRTSDSYMENRFRFKGVLMISVVCSIVFYFIHYGGGGLGVAWVLWCVLEEQRITWGNWFSAFTIWFLGLELSWSALETRTFTHWAISWNPHHPFSWGMVSCGSGWAQTSHVVENDTYLFCHCVHILKHRQSPDIDEGQRAALRSQLSS